MFIPASRIVLLFSFACTGFWSACLPPQGPAGNPNGLRAFFIDVGQGDACLLRTPGNRWFLFDVGNRQDPLIAFLKDVSVDTLAGVFISHPDLDHFGALPALLREIPVKRIFLPSGSNPEKPWQNVLTALDAFTGVLDTLFAGDTLILENGVHARILWPFPHSGLVGNNLSTVLRVEYRSRSLLLTGDIENEAETEMLAARIHAASDILKTAHHGSRTSSGLSFLSAVAPRWAVISCDSAVYGHPHPETIAGLQRVIGDGSRILRTDREGTLGFEIDAYGVKRLALRDLP